MSVKIRIGFKKELHEFKNRKEAFDWVKAQKIGPCVISVLTFERDSLEAMDRWHFDGNRFIRENITN